MVDPGPAVDPGYRGGSETPAPALLKYGQLPDAPDPSFLMAPGTLPPRTKGPTRPMWPVRSAATGPMEHKTGCMRPNVPAVRFFFDLAPSGSRRAVMTGLRAGPVTDAAGLDAVCADLASVV